MVPASTSATPAAPSMIAGRKYAGCFLVSAGAKTSSPGPREPSVASASRMARSTALHSMPAWPASRQAPMADVTGPISTLPGTGHHLPDGTMCDQHPDRPAVARIQGETDSFGCEMNDLCQECIAADREWEKSDEA